ncbi:MAG: hypothetical protein MJ221_03225 [Bacilli bacterium]|nr:hypothetical protein [Bacilli bacterium]
MIEPEKIIFAKDSEGKEKPYMSESCLQLFIELLFNMMTKEYMEKQKENKK